MLCEEIIMKLVDELDELELAAISEAATFTSAKKQVSFRNQ